MTAVVLAGAGCSGGGELRAEKASEAPSESAKAFDPLSFEEPVNPDASGMKSFSPREIQEVVDYLATTYTYEVRTGFTTGFGTVVSSLDCPLVDEVDGLGHAVMEDATSEVLEVGKPYRVDSGFGSSRPARSS